MDESLTAEEQKNNILKLLLYKNISIIIIDKSKTYETAILQEIKLNDPKTLYEFLIDLKEDKYVDLSSTTINRITTEKFLITGNGISFINKGGYQKNKYIKWMLEPENIWKVVAVLLGIGATILIAILTRTK